ncbi:MAG TPA: barstar family protein [Actinomycetes bacterium]|nr:barstar family protein [Actinomycetes bacterium]
MTTEPLDEPVDLDDPELFGDLDGDDVPESVRDAFDGRRGVFVLVDSVSKVRSEATDHDWHTVTLDTSDIDDRAGFISALSDALDLSVEIPSWDVIDEHLRALELDEPNGLLILWEGWGTVADADPDCFEMALEVFQDACIAWQADDFQAAVLLVGEASETDLPTW